MEAAGADIVTAAALRDAVAAAQRGNFPASILLAGAGLKAGGDAVALNAFLGMLYLRERNWTDAINHLMISHLGRPSDVTIACNIIAAQIETGAFTDALAIATRELSSADPSLRIIRYRAFLLQSLERFEDAIACYRFIVERAPDDFESWNNLGNALSAIDRLGEAVTALEKAAMIDPDAAPTRLNLAAALSTAGRTGDAIEILRSGLEKSPGDGRMWYHLYLLLKLDNRNDDALKAIECAVHCEVENVDFLLAVAGEYGLALRLDEAEAAYRLVLEKEPARADAYLGLAIQFEHSNRVDELTSLGELGIRNHLESGSLAFINALNCRRAGQFEAGLRWLSKVPESLEPERSATLRGVMLDRLGKTEQAFASFTFANALHANDPSAPLQRASEYREKIRGEIAILTPEWGKSFSCSAGKCEQPSPVFLVGFPRSGTTLLDTFLMGHPRAGVMEEQPLLNRIDSELGGLANLPSLDAAVLQSARERYLEEADALLRPLVFSVLIDKSPLFLMKVPLIYRLFPNAKFILALRHPCDVLLSCFMSNFRLNTAMSNFLRLDDAAEFYDLSFRHWETARSLFPVNVHTLYYERLVADPENELRPLFEFLNLEWHDSALDHISTAKARGLITTASYSQVAEPIYSRAADRWQRYRTYLDPVIPTLAPWVEKFGYCL